MNFLSRFFNDARAKLLNTSTPAATAARYVTFEKEALARFVSGWSEDEKTSDLSDNEVARRWHSIARYFEQGYNLQAQKKLNALGDTYKQSVHLTFMAPRLVEAYINALRQVATLYEQIKPEEIQIRIPEETVSALAMVLSNERRPVFILRDRYDLLQACTSDTPKKIDGTNILNFQAYHDQKSRNAAYPEISKSLKLFGINIFQNFESWTTRQENGTDPYDPANFIAML